MNRSLGIMGLGLMLWVSLFSLSCHVSSCLPSSVTGTSRSSLVSILGRSRLMMSGELFLVADRYFHRGQRAPKPTPWDDTFLKRASDALHPSMHLHLAGNTIKEMMPWLWFSLKADPRNVDAHLTVAFWLSRALGQNATAHEVLRIAQINNPGVESIAVERGRIYLREGRWKQAWSMFDRGIAVIDADGRDLDADTRFDKAELLLYRALLDEANGNLADARSGYEEILVLFPRRLGISIRLAHLGENKGDFAARAMLMSVLKEQDEGREANCTHVTVHGAESDDDSHELHDHEHEHQ